MTKNKLYNKLYIELCVTGNFRINSFPPTPGKKVSEHKIIIVYTFASSIEEASATPGNETVVYLKGDELKDYVKRLQPDIIDFMREDPHAYLSPALFRDMGYKYDPEWNEYTLGEYYD